MCVNGMGLMLGWLLFGHSLSLSSISHACISCRQDTFWVDIIVDGLVSIGTLVSCIAICSCCGYIRTGHRIPWKESWV